VNFSTFERLEKRIIITGQVQLLSGLHIGTSEASGAAGTDLPVIKDFTGNPFIPGSSFKGVLRSSVESFLRSLPVDDPGSLHCNVIKDESRCITNKMKKQIVEQKNEDKTQDPDLVLWQKSCLVCQLFGSPWLASRVQIRDMPVDKNTFMPEWMMVRDGVVIDRETGTAADKGKYDFEVVPAQTRFNFEIVVENPSDSQMGLLALGLDFFNKGSALLGGKAARGLGRIQILINNIEEQTPDSILSMLNTDFAEGNNNDAGQQEKAEEKELEEKELEEAKDDLPAGKEEVDENDPVSLVCTLLADFTARSHEELVNFLQLKGMEKEQLQKIGYKNWKEFFKDMCKKGHIVETEDGKFHLPGEEKLPAEEEDLEEEIIEDQHSKEQAQAVRSKIQQWQKALWDVLSLLVKVKEEG